MTIDIELEFKNGVVQDFCGIYRIEIHNITNHNPNSNAFNSARTNDNNRI